MHMCDVLQKTGKDSAAFRAKHSADSMPGRFRRFRVFEAAGRLGFHRKRGTRAENIRHGSGNTVHKDSGCSSPGSAASCAVLCSSAAPQVRGEEKVLYREAPRTESLTKVCNRRDVSHNSNLVSFLTTVREA